MHITIPKELTEDLAEEIGLHIGDGSMNIYRGRSLYSLRGHIKDDFDHYKNHILKLFKQIYNADVNLRTWPDVCGFQICSNELIEFKQSLGLPLGNKGEIEIPNSIFNNNKFAISCLKGIFDTDGTLYIENKRGKPYPRVEISTTSKALANQLCMLIRRLGFTSLSCWVTKRKVKNWNNLYRICTRGWISVRKWFNIIQPKNPKHLSKFKYLMENSS